jgi:hypothetical protein
MNDADGSNSVVKFTDYTAEKVKRGPFHGRSPI